MYKTIFILFLGIIIFLFSPIVLAMITGKTLSLDTIALDEKITTNFIFIFQEHNISISDNHNNVKKIHYSIGDDINIRIIDKYRWVYIKGGAMLKTSIDSIDVQVDKVKVHGYMGAFHYDKIDYFVNEKEKFVPKYPK